MKLTKKEIQIIDLRKQNFTQKEVAIKLHISQSAVSVFGKKAKEKIIDASKIIKYARKMKINFEKDF